MYCVICNRNCYIHNRYNNTETFSNRTSNIVRKSSLWHMIHSNMDMAMAWTQQHCMCNIAQKWNIWKHQWWEIIITNISYGIYCFWCVIQCFLYNNYCKLDKMYEILLQLIAFQLHYSDTKLYMWDEYVRELYMAHVDGWMAVIRSILSHLRGK